MQAYLPYVGYVTILMVSMTRAIAPARLSSLTLDVLVLVLITSIRMTIVSLALYN